MLEGVLYERLSAGEGWATVRLLPESPVYAAHFPGYPITPGVTVVQMALELAGADKVSGAHEVKFISPVFPADGDGVRFEWTREEARLRVNVFLPDGTLCAKMSLDV